MVQRPLLYRKILCAFQQRWLNNCRHMLLISPHFCARMTPYSIKQCKYTRWKRPEEQNIQLTDKKIDPLESCGTKEAADKVVIEVCDANKRVGSHTKTPKRWCTLHVYLCPFYENTLVDVVNAKMKRGKCVNESVVADLGRSRCTRMFTGIECRRAVQVHWGNSSRHISDSRKHSLDLTRYAAPHLLLEQWTI